MPPYAPNKACPCGSGRTYATCCRVYHRAMAGRRPDEAVVDAVVDPGGPPPTAEALMRARYSAFAVGDVPFLVATVHSSHEDAAVERAQVEGSLREVVRAHKYMGLTVIDTDEARDEPCVLFFARVFQRGTDQSFVELSTFARDAGVLRYRGGILAPHPARTPLPAGLTVGSAPKVLAVMAASGRRTTFQ